MVLPYIYMTQPWVYMYSLFWASLPIPSLWVIPVHQLWAPCLMHWTWKKQNKTLLSSHLNFCKCFLINLFTFFPPVLYAASETHFLNLYLCHISAHNASIGHIYLSESILRTRSSAVSEISSFLSHCQFLIFALIDAGTNKHIFFRSGILGKN